MYVRSDGFTERFQMFYMIVMMQHEGSVKHMSAHDGNGSHGHSVYPATYCKQDFGLRD